MMMQIPERERHCAISVIFFSILFRRFFYHSASGQITLSEMVYTAAEEVMGRYRRTA